MIKSLFLIILIMLIPFNLFAQEKALVVKVLEGNILELEDGRKVKLIGIDSSKAAYEFTKSKIEGKTVRLEFDSQKENKEGETLAYVYFKSRFNKEVGHLDDDFPKEVFLNTELIKKGYASSLADSINKKYSDLFQKIYQQARENKRGLHGRKSR